MMSLTLGISLSIISIAALIVLLYKDEWFEGLRYPLVRALFSMMGIGLLFLGISFFQRAWFMSAFFGTLFSILGVQIALWGVGISLDFLGNKPTDIDTPDRQEHSRREENRLLSRLILNHVEVAIGILKYARATDNLKHAQECTNALSTEMDKILKIIFDNSHLFPRYWIEHELDPFIEYSPRFRFEAQRTEAAHHLEILERLKERLTEIRVSVEFFRDV